jgi:hypothetical protein
LVEALFHYEPIIVVNVALLVPLGLILVVFLLQQLYYISKNVTRAEIGKIDAAGAGYRHFYDKGFIGNWRECLFPPKVQKHEPVDYTAEIRAQQKKGKAKKD